MTDKELMEEEIYKQLEKQYLSKQNRYYLEKQILEDMSLFDISSLYEGLDYEKKIIDHKIKKNLKEVNSFEDLKPLEKIFLMYLLTDYNMLDRKKDLEGFINKLKHKKMMLENKDNDEFVHVDVNNIPITSVMSSYFQVPSNFRHTIKCPFPDHNEKTGSFKIYPNTNSCYCFGCKRGGDVVEFISIMEGVGHKEAFDILKNY